MEHAVIAEDIAAETSLATTTEPTEVGLVCPGCGEPFLVRLALVVRQLNDEAELVTVVTQMDHRHHHRQDATSMYVVGES
jgi:hypothetical protein